MRVIVANDEGAILVDYSTKEGANVLRPGFGEEGHSIAALAETIQFLAPPLDEALSKLVAVAAVPGSQMRKAPALRLVEAEPAPAH